MITGLTTGAVPAAASSTTLTNSVMTAGAQGMTITSPSTGANTALTIVSQGGGNASYVDFKSAAILQSRIGGYDGELSAGTIVNGPITLFTNSAARLTILGSGNVGIGTTTPSEKLEVIGNIRAVGQLSTSSQTISSGTTAINWNNGNAISTDYNCASNFAFANLRDGGTYTLVVTDTGTTQCGFSATTTGTDAATVSYRFNPANAARTASSHTVYTLMRVGAVVYVSWSSGF